MRDLPDGAVRLWRTTDHGGSFYISHPGMIVTHIALPTAAFEDLVDKAGRVDGLEARLDAMKSMLMECRVWPVNEATARGRLTRIDALLGDAR